MGANLRVPLGILGNAASLLLYAAPILTFKRVIKKGSTEKFSCIPYILALSNCLLYTWYSLPVVSHGWENFTVASINGLGIILECSFILVYIWFASADKKKSVVLALLPVIVVFSMTASVSTFALHDHGHRKVFVGSIGMVASISMYSSPLVAMKRVIQTKSVEFMPFYLSFFSFLASSLWMAYGLLGHEIFIASPNFIATPMGLLQIVLYCMYRKGKAIPQEPNKSDLEENVAKVKIQQHVLVIEKK